MAGRELDGQVFDVVLLGTGVEQAIVASEAAAAGRSVLHVDRSGWYGGGYACFTPSRLVEWAGGARDRRLVPRVELAENTAGAAAESALAGVRQGEREYALDLAPRAALCRGSLVELLIDTGVGDHVQFRGVEHNYLVRPGGPPQRIPASKEDVFASAALSLVEKRKLMRLLATVGDDAQYAAAVAAAGDAEFSQFLRDRFRLDGDLLDAVRYAVARVGPGEPVAARAGCERVRAYVRSMGRYGRMAYLCALYGSGSEIAQAFCRACAVAGGTYVLAADVGPVTRAPDDDDGSGDGDGDGARFRVPLAGGAVRARHVVMDASYAPPDAVRVASTLSRAICILDRPALGDDATATASYVAEQGAVSLLYTTRATMSAPAGRAVLYAWTPGALDERRGLLASALSATHGPAAAPLLTIYMEVNVLAAAPVEHVPGLHIVDTPDATLGLEPAVAAARRILGPGLGIEAYM
ncbi:hypothetical protein H4R18_000242 [Coemansia javaensis]|uniref:Rab proteins geranylgeranyltransferase component n=1 Tax=Coemansia javaensis TaxID=2761396 RepID=A0A9W8HHA3_9FUNG|nr:hypothetical protein H4R18_000242 [Coemansia javaensis]